MTYGTLQGQWLGKYRVLEPLGAGGMARVYRAHHAQLDRDVAIKVLRSDLAGDPEFLARFHREARAVAALRHPNIVQVFDFDAQGDVVYMVMELLEGDSLKARLGHTRARAERMPVGEAARVMLDALAGLAYAHGEGLIHRDLKPANLMLTRRGQAVLTDFGIAQIVGGAPLTMAGTLMGSLHYMAPEQGQLGQYDARSDVYALGVVLYEMLVGRVPFDADTPLAILHQHATQPLPPPRSLNPALPQPLERVLQVALSKAPADRYPTAAAMSAALSGALADAGLALPESIPPLPLAAAPPAPAVFSGAARAALAHLPLVNDETDTTLKRPAPPTRAPRSALAALGLGLGVWLAANILGVALGGALGDLGRFASLAWPLQMMLLAFTFGLLLEAAAWRGLIIPSLFFINLSVLLSYYAFTQRWTDWFWWPLLLLAVIGESWLAVRWAGAAAGRARRLGQTAAALAAGFVVVETLAIVIIVLR
ncbi:MAG: protein kinase [Anaerolineales bacterium]